MIRREDLKVGMYLKPRVHRHPLCKIISIGHYDSTVIVILLEGDNKEVCFVFSTIDRYFDIISEKEMKLVLIK